jgi:hypothetical protein
MIEIGDGTQVHVAWTVSGREGNFLAVALKQPDQDWEIQYRFEHTTGAKRWVRVMPKGACKHVVEQMFDHVSAQLAKSWRTRVTKKMIGAAGAAAFHALLDLPGMTIVTSHAAIDA